jgi:hypothetical protein
MAPGAVAPRVEHVPHLLLLEVGLRLGAQLRREAEGIGPLVRHVLERLGVCVVERHFDDAGERPVADIVAVQRLVATRPGQGAGGVGGHEHGTARGRRGRPGDGEHRDGRHGSRSEQGPPASPARHGDQGCPSQHDQRVGARERRGCQHEAEGQRQDRAAGPRRQQPVEQENGRQRERHGKRLGHQRVRGADRQRVHGDDQTGDRSEGEASAGCGPVGQAERDRRRERRCGGAEDAGDDPLRR